MMTDKDPAISKSYTFIQMNFWSGRLYYPIDRFLTREKPDIFSAQEILSTSMPIDVAFHTIESVLGNNHFTQVYKGGFRSFISDEISEYCATFTKDKFKNIYQNIVPLYLNSSDPSEKEKGHANYSSLLHVTLESEDGYKVHILNHHGRLVKGESGRISSPVADYNFKHIADYAATLQGPIILSGDFNLVKEATSLQPLKDIGLINLNDVHNISEARNEFSWRTNEAVSHLFINDAIIMEEYRIATDNVSDHLPLILRFKLKY